MATETISGNVVTLTDVVKDAKDRIKTDTPPFFKRIQRWAKTAAWIAGGVGSAGVIIVTSVISGGIAVPVWITITMSCLSGLGTLGAGVGIGAAKIANMTTANKEILNRPSNEVVK